MNVYYLELVGLRTALRTPYEITISENLRPFLCPPHEQTDCTISLQSCNTLPSFAENGVWHGLEYYDYHKGAARIFHCEAPKKETFAVTQLFENGNIHIDVLPACLSYFTGSTGIFNRIGMETLLLQHHGLLLHASLIKYKGRSIAFTGPSGVGKSTHAEIWRNCLSAEIINGDRAALRKTADGWIAAGSPYAGTSGIYKNESAPLSAIVLLRQADENRLQRLTKNEAFQHIYPELSLHHWDKAFVEAAMDLCLQLLQEIPVYLLACRPDENAALLVKEGLDL
jgi:hypothetical protein